MLWVEIAVTLELVYEKQMWSFPLLLCPRSIYGQLFMWAFVLVH